jgi:methionyl-tRNA formyltransferase
VTIMRVTAGLDSGPVALTEEVAIEGADDYASLSERLASVSGDLVVRALDALASRTLHFTDQDEDAATYAEKVLPEERRLDPTEPVEALERRVRALTPHIGAYLELEGGERLGVRSAAVAQADRDSSVPGRIVADGDRLLLIGSDGVLRLDVVQPPGKKPMSAADFLRGHALPGKAV